MTNKFIGTSLHISYKNGISTINNQVCLVDSPNLYIICLIFFDLYIGLIYATT